MNNGREEYSLPSGKLNGSLQRKKEDTMNNNFTSAKMKVNGHNNLYVVCFGNRKYDIERVWQNEKQFNSLTDARQYANGYYNSSIFKLHFASDSGDLEYIMEV